MSSNRATDFGRSQDPLQSMLQWGLANSDSSAQPVDQQRSKEHVALLNKVLKEQAADSDAERMKAAIIVINDTQSSLDDRLEAWDQLEMLVESIDNANDLKPLGMWPDIVKHFHSQEPEVVVQALWVAGTAVQNNPSAQTEFLATDPLPVVINLIQSTSSSAEIRSKAIYTLGSAIKHNEAAVDAFVKAKGWQSLDFALKDPNVACRRKAAFLVDSMLRHAASTTQLLESARNSSDVISTLVQSMTSNALPFGSDGDQTNDADLTEKSACAVFNLLQKLGKSALTAQEIEQVRETLEEKDANELGLASGEYTEFKRLLDA